MKLPVRRVIGILNGFFNPLLLCAFLPIIEGAPGLDLTSPTGFWGQLIVATVIAEVLSALPMFGKTVGMCLNFFGFEQGSASHEITGTVIGATLLFMAIGFGEIASREDSERLEAVRSSRVGQASSQRDGLLWLSLACCSILLQRLSAA
ncbi:hypothetical protein DXA64_02105 [Collinsella sp. OF03-4AA]|nr:hypothetical protein DXA64_02105 [Collinsella sp. OF03-4AA]